MRFLIEDVTDRLDRVYRVGLDELQVNLFLEMSSYLLPEDFSLKSRPNRNHYTLGHAGNIN